MIYRDSMLEGFIQTLKETYPVCQKLVGEAFFSAMASIYVQQTPSHSSDLGDYGKTFADFIANFSPAKSLPYLADIARFECKWARIFHGPKPESLDFMALTNVSADKQEEIIFHLSSTVALLTSMYPIYQIWLVNQTNYQGDTWVDLDQEPEHLLIYRQDLSVNVIRLTKLDWDFLTALKTTKKLSELCAVFPEAMHLLPKFVELEAIGF